METPSKYLVIMGTFFTSLSSIIIRFSKAPALTISAYRMLFASMMLFPFILKQMAQFKQIRKKEYILCLISGIFLALHFATWISSIKLTTVANSTILVSCSPIFAALANYFINKEKINVKMTIGIIISFIGTMVIAIGSPQGSGHNPMLGNVLAFLGAIFVAFYLVIGGIVRKSLSAGIYVFIVYSISAIILFLMCFITKTQVYPYGLKEILLFVALAFFCSILGHTIYNYMVKYVSSTFISVSSLSEPIFASIMAVFVFNEIPSTYTLTGGIIIITGISYYLLAQNKQLSIKEEENVSS